MKAPGWDANTTDLLCLCANGIAESLANLFAGRSQTVFFTRGMESGSSSFIPVSEKAVWLDQTTTNQLCYFHLLAKSVKKFSTMAKCFISQVRSCREADRHPNECVKINSSESASKLVLVHAGVPQNGAILSTALCCLSFS